MTTPNSRRRFIKDSASLLAASIAIPALAGCGNNSVPVCSTVTNSFLGNTSMLNGGVAGLLYSQIGYEPGHPVRLVVRMSEKLAGDKLSGVFLLLKEKPVFVRLLIIGGKYGKVIGGYVKLPNLSYRECIIWKFMPARSYFLQAKA